MRAQWKEFQQSHPIISIVSWRIGYHSYAKKGSVWLFDTSTVVPRKRVSGGRNVRQGESGGSVFNLRPFVELLPPLLSPVVGNEISPRSHSPTWHRGSWRKFSLGCCWRVLQKEVRCALWEDGMWQLFVSLFDMCQPMWSDMWWQSHAGGQHLLLCW